MQKYYDMLEENEHLKKAFEIYNSPKTDLWKMFNLPNELASILGSITIQEAMTSEQVNVEVALSCYIYGVDFVLLSPVDPIPKGAYGYDSFIEGVRVALNNCLWQYTDQPEEYIKDREIYDSQQ